MKIVRNMGHGIATAAIGECLRLAADLGIPRDLALSTVANGPFSWTYNWRQAEFASRDHSQVVFSLDLMAKDLALAVAESDRPLAVSLRRARAVRRRPGRGPRRRGLPRPRRLARGLAAQCHIAPLLVVLLATHGWRTSGADVTVAGDDVRR